jgi:putative hydrolase of the HAD superfamily
MLEWTAGRWSVAELWRRWLESEAVRAFESGRMEPEPFARAMVVEFELPVTPGQYLREFTYWPSHPFPGAARLLESLADSYVLGCLSNTNRLHWDRIRDEMQLLRHFRHAFASHQTGFVKPDREAFEHALRALGCRPQEVLFLDDSQANVAAAAAIGLRALRVEGVSGAIAALGSCGIQVET